MQRLSHSCFISLILAALGTHATAQFSQFAWTLANHGSVESFVDADTMWFQTRHDGIAGSVAAFKTQAPVAARVSVHADFFIEELVCGSSTAVWSLGSSATTFSNCFYGDVLVFDVGESQSFGYGMSVNSPSWIATLYLTDFQFEPYWDLLGGALAGSAGAPALTGHGILQPGKPFSVALAGGAPTAPVGLVVGLGEVNLPFKGGILVPSVDALIVGLATGAAGELTLASSWPGIPVGSQLVLQAWIQDPSGPQGFAASNALRANAL